MQEFAPTKSRLAGSCPSDEELAAYMDGGLDQAEKEQIAVHLISCERCYEIYSEALQFQLDSNPPGNVVRFRLVGERGKDLGRLGVAVRWLAAAALLLVGVGSGVYFWFLKSPPALVVAEMTTSLPNKQGLLGNFWVGQTTRGPGDHDEIPFDEASFRMGVQVVNLRLSLEANDIEGARKDILPRIFQVLQTQAGASALEDYLRAFSADLGVNNSPKDLLGKADNLALTARDYFDEHYLDLGQWTEAGRLAALAHNPSFFQQSETRKFLRQLRWNDKFGWHDIKLDPTTRQSLDRISEVLSRSDLRPSDYAELQQELEMILKHLYPEI